MKTSLILATYNGEKNILEQLDSIKNQTMCIDEVIICDDFSEDGTVNIIKKYISDNSLNKTWKLIENKKNIGFISNFKKLLLEVSNEIVFLSDQDDIWYLDKVERMIRCHEKVETPIALVSDVNQISESNALKEKIALKKIKYKSMISKEEELYRVIFCKENLVNRRPGWSFSLNKELIPKVVDFLNESTVTYHDEAIWLTSISIDKLYYLNCVTGKWRRHLESQTARGIDINSLKERNIKYFDYRISTLIYLKKMQMNPGYLCIVDEEIKTVNKRKEMILEKNITNLFYLLKKNSVQQTTLDLLKMLLLINYKE